MRRLACAACVLSVWVVATAAQDPAPAVGQESDVEEIPGLAEGAEVTLPTFEDFMRPLILSPNLTVQVVQMNDFTTENIFEPPTMYAMRAQARGSAMFFIQGTATGGVDFDPAQFRLEQRAEGQASPTVLRDPAVVNLANFEAGRVTTNSRVDGVIQFKTELDYSRPFTVLYGTSRAEFAFDDLRMLVAMPPVANAQPQ